MRDSLVAVDAGRVALEHLHLSAGDTLTGGGYQRYRTAAQLCAAGLNFGLNLWLIPAYSWHGAAWASLVTDGGLAAGNWMVLGFLIRREKSVRLVERVARTKLRVLILRIRKYQCRLQLRVAVAMLTRWC